MVISTIKINQALIMLALLDRNNTTNQNRMRADFLHLLNFTIKIYQSIFTYGLVTSLFTSKGSS